MSVELEPAELGFKRPFTHEVSQVLRLHNPNSDPLAFKVKTTAPKQYCVRPNAGRIEPNQQVEVQVLLQAMKEDPPPDARCRDKFLVQSVAVKAESDAANVSQIWANIEQTAKSTIQEKKIRVNFLPADSGTTTNGVAGGEGMASAWAPAGGVAQHDDDHSELPPSYSSPTASSAATPQRGVSGAGDNKDAQEAMDAYATSASSAAGSTLPSTVSNAASSVPTSQSELQSQLDEARNTITRLQAQAAEGLRQRKPDSAQGAAQGAMDTVKKMGDLQNAPAPGGVPIQIVAGLVLAAFLVAYLFF